jgi:thymidine kinase
MNGYIELAIGPMFAGKSSWIVGLYKRFKFYTNNIIVINYIGDTRYSQTELSTHDKTTIPCIHCEKLSNITIPEKTEVILINEGQFFSDIVEWTKQKADYENKRIYICGLDGDYNRDKFGHLLDLIPYCDKVTKLSALCGNCKNGTPAIFTHRISNEKGQVLIGEKDHYLPVCRKCYISFK